MTSKTYHVLMTRFNVQFTATADPRALSLEWLKARLRLFKEITFASVASQSRLPDAWLVFFDEGTPDDFRDEFRQVAAELPILHEEYCGVFGLEVSTERIRRIIPSDADWLLTTRLDNDDALNPCFIETVRAQAHSGIREFLNPTQGLIVANGRAFRRRDYSSPFITLSEPVVGCSTVWIDQHQLLSRYGPVRQFALADAWIQVVHGGNLANHARGTRILPDRISHDTLPPWLRGTLIPVKWNRLLRDNIVDFLRKNANRVHRRIRWIWSGN
jgi:hypothetical protein